MADEYKIFYLKDLVPIIYRVALEAMRETMYFSPITATQFPMAQIMQSNSLIAEYNQGIREMTDKLLHALETDGETEGDGNDT